MHNTNAELSRKSTKLTQPVMESFERETRDAPLPTTSRASVVGRQIHDGRSLEKANQAITAARRAGHVEQVRPQDRLFLVDADYDAETLLDLLSDQTMTADALDAEQIGAINARIQQLRGNDDE